MTANITDILYCYESPERPGLSRQQQERKAVNNLIHELARAHKFLPHKTLLAALQAAALLSLRAYPTRPGQGAAYARFITSTPLSVDESDTYERMKLQSEINAIEQKIRYAQQEFDIADKTYNIDRGNTTAKSQRDKALNRIEDLRRDLIQTKFNK